MFLLVLLLRQVHCNLSFYKYGYLEQGGEEIHVEMCRYNVLSDGHMEDQERDGGLTLICK
jgi:hypothetical protein